MKPRKSFYNKDSIGKKLGSKVWDGWENVVTNLNIKNKDKKTASKIKWKRMSQQECQWLFAEDKMARKIATTVPFDGTREGVTFKVDSEKEDEEKASDSIKAINEEHGRLDTWQKLFWAWSMGDANGGAVIYMSIDDGKLLEDPVDIKGIRKVTALHVFERWRFTTSETDIIRELGDPDFGLPEFYNYTSDGTIKLENTDMGSTVKIHKSRILRFDGLELPRELFKSNGYWGDSVYNSTRDQIRDYSVSHSTIATILTEINQPIFKIYGLHEALAQDKDEIVTKRLNIIASLRSALRAIAIDKEDDFGHVNQALNGVKDLVDLIKQNMTAVSNIPHDRLLGESPGASLGEAGKGQKVNYYDQVAAQQEVKLRKNFDYLTTILFNQKDVDIAEPENWSFTFDPLQQQSQKEIIETRKIQADIDNIYMQRGVYDAFETADSRFASGEYSYETTLHSDDERASRYEETISIAESGDDAGL